MNLFTLSILLVAFTHTALAAVTFADTNTLSAKQKSIVLMAAFTAKGELSKLKPALNVALDSGVTVNECKEVIVHAYAYCGFPRSISALQTLMATLDERDKQGIKNNIGRTATIISDTNKYETGWKNLAKLSGRSAEGPVEKPATGYGAFSPEIDRFLKEHLFADLFSRDLLTFAERELATISVLTALGKGVEPMLATHLELTMKQGFTAPQINAVFALIAKSVNREDATAGRKVFEKMEKK